MNLQAHPHTHPLLISDNPRPRIGFIGLGVMGGAMVQRLLQAGHEMLLWSRRPESAQAFTPQGAKVCDSIEHLASLVDVLMINVTATDDVQSLLFGAPGTEPVKAQATQNTDSDLTKIASGDPNAPAVGSLFYKLKPGTVVLDFSTIDADQSRSFSHALEARDVIFMDSPVSGGGKGAREGSLSIMVGGPQHAFEAVKGLLAPLGQTIVHTGGFGSGQVVKACNQMVMCTTLCAIAEAAAYAKALGADFHTVVKVLQGSLGASRVLDWAGPKIAAQDFQAGIQSRLHAKDLHMIAAQVRGLGLDLPLVQQVSEWLDELVDRGWGMDDTSQVVKVVQARGR